MESSTFSSPFHANKKKRRTENLVRRITSYINNLHPKAYKPLYEVIERIIELAIPLWNQTLTPLKSCHYNTPRIDYNSYESDSNPDSLSEESQAQQPLDESESDYPEQNDNLESDTSPIVKPEPDDFALPRWDLNDDGTQLNDEMRVDLKKEFSERGLQIIVKLANIHLTPERPDYDGGKWHVEGRPVRVYSFFTLIILSSYALS
jgi:Protein of unknown function (DUF4246)